MWDYDPNNVLKLDVRGVKVMKMFKILVVLCALVISGCGDQFWCGSDGCGSSREANKFADL
jgi:hypothetical protein